MLEVDRDLNVNPFVIAAPPEGWVNHANSRPGVGSTLRVASDNEYTVS